MKQNVDEQLDISEEQQMESPKKTLSQNLTSSFYDNLNSINMSVSGTSPKSNPNVLDNLLLYDNVKSNASTINNTNANNNVFIESYDNIDNIRSSSINSLNQIDNLNKNIIDQLCYVTDYTSSKIGVDQDLSNIASNLKKEVAQAQRQAEKLDKLDDMTITKVVQMNIPSKSPPPLEEIKGDEDVTHLDESWQILIQEVKDLSNLDNKSKKY